MVSAARTGDRDALDAVLRAHHAQIHALCRRLTGNDHDALDATQEALIAVVRGLPRFDGRSALSTWIHRVATNAALDELRRRQRRPVLRLARDDASSGDPALDDPGPPPGGPPPLDTGVSDRLDLDEALLQLSETFRVPVVLRDVLGLDYAEIAEVLDLPAGTVRSRIARGRAALARALRPAAEPAGNRTAGVTVEQDDQP